MKNSDLTEHSGGAVRRSLQPEPASPPHSVIDLAECEAADDQIGLWAAGRIDASELRERLACVPLSGAVAELYRCRSSEEFAEMLKGCKERLLARLEWELAKLEGQVIH